jgi:hypothetical protein
MNGLDPKGEAWGVIRLRLLAARYGLASQAHLDAWCAVIAA